MKIVRTYLGEEVLDVHKTKFIMYTQQDWIMMWIERYSGIDGSHHKDWLIDQIARISKGTKVIVSLAKWDDGKEEFRFCLDTPTKEYTDWVVEMCDGEDGPNTYTYDAGVAP